MTNQIHSAKLLHSLHVPGRPLVLPNAWDVASARIIEEAGAPVIATTSAGVAWSLGSPDGDRLGRDRALGLISRVVAGVAVPVTADIETGYGNGPDDVGETVAGVLAAGAVGVNIEDGWLEESPLRPADEQAKRIAAARQAGDAAGVPLFINARVDAYLRNVGDEPTRLEATVERSRAYLAAGASGIFVPGVVKAEIVAALVSAIDAPVNIMTGPGAPPVGELAALGVARVSLGPAIPEAAYAVARRAAREMLTTGTYTAIAEALDYRELNALMR